MIDYFARDIAELTPWLHRDILFTDIAEVAPIHIHEKRQATSSCDNIYCFHYYLQHALTNPDFKIGTKCKYGYYYPDYMKWFYTFPHDRIDWEVIGRDVAEQKRPDIVVHMCILEKFHGLLPEHVSQLLLCGKFNIIDLIKRKSPYTWRKITQNGDIIMQFLTARRYDLATKAKELGVLVPYNIRDKIYATEGCTPAAMKWFYDNTDFAKKVMNRGIRARDYGVESIMYDTMFQPQRNLRDEEYYQYGRSDIY